ncbi:MAG: formylglycine-generating enzyme family protein [Ardenticatenaceae bacterium]|nr:formylglycine-generating enzyme family protein [Ardenticatenaceae bacterium]
MTRHHSILRKFMTDGLSDIEVLTLALDYFPTVYQEINVSGMIHSAKVMAVVHFAMTSGQLTHLQNALQQEFPLEFEHFLKSLSSEDGVENDPLPMKTGADGRQMIKIPAGPFAAGSPPSEITLDEFWIDQQPVSNQAYKRFLDAHPTYPVPDREEAWAQPFNWDRQTRLFPAGHERLPVNLISLKDAQAYAAWAGKRLPTEWEWEKAARGVDGRDYPWGRWQPNAANTSELSAGRPLTIGQFSPLGDSPYGGVDFCGNVWEWTDSTMDNDPHKIVIRGGSWLSPADQAYCWYRNWFKPFRGSHVIGFRCAI